MRRKKKKKKSQKKRKKISTNLIDFVVCVAQFKTSESKIKLGKRLCIRD